VNELVRLDPVVEVVWRAFELRPEPVATLDPKGEYLPARLGKFRLSDGREARDDDETSARAAPLPLGT
jgi:hypothetical protein